MELNFVQSSEVFGKNTLAWETEFEATGDFNLHVERNKGGDILVYQRTAGSGYAIVEEFRGMDNKPAIDLDFTSVVYPKFVKIVSESQPTYATVTSDGEITEIKSQSKEVEVTANGTMDITPDAGFSYLNSVKVKTNVAGGGNGGGSGVSYKFYSIEKLESKVIATEYAMPSFARVNGMILPAVLAYAGNMWESVSAVSVDTSANIFMEGEWKNIGEILDVASSMLQSIGIAEITEEEFYNLA